MLDRPRLISATFYGIALGLIFGIVQALVSDGRTAVLVGSIVAIAAFITRAMLPPRSLHLAAPVKVGLALLPIALLVLLAVLA